MNKPTDSCELCKKEKLTRQYYEDDKFWITLCKSCGCILIVSQKHEGVIKDKDMNEILDIGKSIANLKYGRNMHSFDYKRNADKDHWHVHIRLIVWNKLADNI